MTRAEVGFTVTHRRYVPYSHAHYAGNLVDGAYSLAAFGDVATELCIRTDGDEGLFASYSSVQFLAPVRAGDVIEIEARLVRVGTRSREMEFEVRVVGRGAPERGVSGTTRRSTPPRAPPFGRWTTAGAPDDDGRTLWQRLQEISAGGRDDHDAARGGGHHRRVEDVRGRLRSLGCASADDAHLEVHLPAP